MKGSPLPAQRSDAGRRDYETIATSLEPEEAVTFLLGAIQELEAALYSREELDIGVHLTPVEERLLSALMGANGRLLSRDRLLSAICFDRHSDGDLPDVNAVSCYVSRVRKKLPKDLGWIQAVWGRGYRFVSAT